MKKILYLLFLTFAISYSQDQASNWYFGDNAGIQFNTTTGTVISITDGQLRTDEGCTSISDQDGNLLFYTDGITVFDKAHNVMPNGNSLKGNPSSTQSAIIIPKPEDEDIYYIFTVDTEYQGSIDEGFHYSEVDMSLNAGFGSVTATKNIQLLSNTSEKLSAVLKDCESGNIWVITFADSSGGDRNDTFYAYEVSNTGINLTPVASNSGINIDEKRGYLKFSPDGTKLAAANIGQGLFLFDFDTDTGLVSNRQQININFNSATSKPQSSYGLEFSPDSQLLYVTTYYETPNSDFSNPNAQYGALLQYDLNAANISASEVVIDDRQMYRSALQLAPNGKIFRSLSETYNTGVPFLSTIENPNTIGIGCNYQHANIDLNGRNARQGLPPFISSFFTEKIDITGNATETTFLPLCTGDIFTLFADDIPGATYSWSYNGTPLPNSSYDLTISQPGSYELIIDLNSADCETLEGKAIIEYYDIPTATQPNDYIVCDDNNNAHWAFDLSSQDAQILDTQDPNIYSVHYFENQVDANNNENEIVGAYDNQTNPETIFARIHNINNPNCYDTTTFRLQIFNTPIANTVDDFITCDDGSNDGDDTNGQTDILLTDFNSDVLGTQNAADYTITYHNSLTDATNNNPPLANTYYNVTPINETIFARIENNLNPDCFDTTSFNITVNPKPNRYDSSLFQCDEDGTIDGNTVFNLTEAEDALTGSATNVSVTFHTLLIDAQNEENEVDATSFPNTSNPQEIFALITDNTTECAVIAKLRLEVSTTQIQDYTPQPVCDELDSEDGLNTFNLDDFTAEIQNLNSIALPITYYENYNDALVEQNQLVSPYTNIEPYTQTIYARAEDNNACYGISEITLTINKRPELVEDETTYYCLNSYPETIPLESGVIGNPNEYTYLWSNGETTNQILINEAGSYTVTVTNSENCEKSRTIIVEASNIATIDSIEVLDAVSNNTIVVNASGEGEYEYAIFNDAGLYAYYQTSNTFTNVAPGGIYTVSIRDIKNGCGIVEEKVSVIGFPKFFTPNNDGVNDYWQVYGVSSIFQPNTKIKIYNRYGKLIKQISPIGQGWDGSFNGENLPNDDYWFAVTLQDGREYFNHFTLKR
ncbi:T9SS type B sorting domain-containing protein [Lacinutrix cladophorae]